MSADGQLWYLMIDKKRVGPITEDEVREKYEQREIGSRTYAWTPGQGKWERLFNLPELFSSDTMRGTGSHKEPKFKSTMPMPMLGDEDTVPPADPDDASMDDLDGVDPHAVTTQWDPEDVEAAIKEVEAKKAAKPKPKLEPGDDEPEELLAKAPNLDDDLAELFGRPTGPKPQVTESAREASTPDAAAEPPVREVSTPDSAAEPPVREVSSPQVEPLKPEPEDDEDDEDDAPALFDLALVDPLADTSPHDPADDIALAAILPKEDSAEQPPDEKEVELKSSLLGERDEDSVLFSRDQLDDLVHSLGYGSSDDESEQSLIDIKPLADDTLASVGGGNDLPAAPLPVAAPAANILFPAEEPTKRRSLVSILLMSFVGIILAFGLLVGAIYLASPNLIHALLEGKLDKQIAGDVTDDGSRPAAAKGASPGAPAPGTPPAAKAAPPAKTAAAPTEDTPEPAKVARGDTRRTPRKGPRRKRGKGKRPAVAAVDPTRTAAPVKAAPAPAARKSPVALPAAKKKPAKKGGDELDRLIDGALDGKSPRAAPEKAPAPVKKAPPPAPSRGKLTREVFNMAMSMAEDDVNACGKRHGKRGVVTIKISINGDTGRITRGRAVGSNAGTAVGTCVVSAAKKSARFPKFGGARTMSYAYILK